MDLELDDVVQIPLDECLGQAVPLGKFLPSSEPLFSCGSYGVKYFSQLKRLEGNSVKVLGT